MKLSMGLGQGLELKQEAKLDQRLELKQRLAETLEQRQALRLAVVSRFEELFRSSGDAPEIMVDDVIGRAFGALPPASRKICEETLGMFPTLGRDMIGHSHLLALTNAGRMSEFALRVLYAMQDGQFFDDDGDKERRASLADIVKTLRDRTWAERERDHVKRLMATQAGTGGALVDDYRRLEKSLQITELLKPSIDQLAAFVRIVLSARDPQTGETIQACIREQAIVEKFFPLASARVEQRLVTSMQKIAAKDGPERFEHATLNSIGESLLVALGVLAPELFEIKHLSNETLEDGERSFAELGYDVAAMRHLFEERKAKGVFWHRWKTTTVKPGALTDLAVREFITEHLRQDRVAVLEACQYPEFFAQSQELAVERRAAKEPTERAILTATMESHAMEMLGGAGLHECLKKLSAGSWYRDLDTFFQKR